MIDIPSNIMTGFTALDRGDYRTAQHTFAACLASLPDTGASPVTSFNVHYGIALALFGQYMQERAENGLLDAAISHAEQAAAVYERRYDLQFLLGQCYATQYQLTQEPSSREKAREAYAASKRYATHAILPTEEETALEERISTLLLELEGN